jgi:hypothetical protein
MTIWKYEISVEDDFELEMPESAKILKVSLQDNIPTMWVLVDKANQREKRRFAIYGTGQSLPDNYGTYIDTFLVRQDSLVWHLFETTTMSYKR